MSVLTEWYGRNRLPESNSDWRWNSTSAWPIALVKIGSRYSIPVGDGRISSASYIEACIWREWISPQRTRDELPSKLAKWTPLARIHCRIAHAYTCLSG